MREKLVELIAGTKYGKDLSTTVGANFQRSFIERIADHLIANGVMVLQPARPLEEWDEDHGDVLWWRFPIEEPPYVGSPLDAAWPGYHTHWTPIPIPTEVNNAEMQ